MSETVTQHSPPSHARTDSHGPLYWKLSCAYLLLLIYGTLFPLSGWDWQRGNLHTFISLNWPAHVSRGDVVTNLVVYVPLGLLLALWWRGRFGGGATLALVTLCGTSLSLGLEYLQSYLPQRVSSPLDTALNGTGTFLGALLAGYFNAHQFRGGRLHRLRHRWFLPGSIADLGLITLGLWALAQLSPWVPSLDLGNLRQGLSPLARTLTGAVPFSLAQGAVYALNVATLGLVFTAVAQPRLNTTKLFVLFIAAVLVLKVPIVGRQLSLEAIAGAGAGLLLWAALRNRPPRVLPWLAALLLLLAHSLDNLRVSDPHGPLLLINWIPFKGQMQTLSGLPDIIAAIWPYAALAWLAALARPASTQRAASLGGGLLFIYALGLEWLQQRLPGRYPDITDAVLGLLAWAACWAWLGRHAGEVPPPPARPPRRHRPSLATAAGGVALALVAVASIIISAPLERPLDESRLAQLPAPETLMPVALTNFRFTHPRLPAPSAAEIVRLRDENPHFMRVQSRRAAGGKGNLEAVVLMAVLDPGSQDLDLLHQRLLVLDFQWRGHLQVKPLAMAYDWLYDAWSEPQRGQLRAKLLDGCDYQIRYIRKERLSPYNVILYNSPFQALMACAIAAYGDDPRADAIMAFTQDLWKNRVLPVWRQIMGQNGGWHEGGEYVGIGIGQAIYQVPAMWRHATGEDLFKTEPGLRGFLDFLVYRTRPDGTHFRWGDAGFFDRIVPDQAALALEYRHPAAYSLRRPPAAPTPTGWPWGPLTDPGLYDPQAAQRLPLTKHFDGLGLIVARNGWDKDSTYVTFKAGDNYWSHVHLDQGAFTIYKGGALAIDSGLYGTGYGTDHHMNYAYQTIAHNVVTVTDPEDTVPMPARGDKEPRHLANDGGQRRIGSGWGVEAGPLDLAEWESKREIYHTGKIEQLLLDQDGLTVAAADLTPAYTNELSGQDTFSHRTRRVEKYTRTFGYDRVDDVVVIFDRVIATEPGFPKRWLLHTLEKPVLSDDGFIVPPPVTKPPGRAAGQLDARVLLPKDPLIATVGGAGQEFLVDGNNYGEGVATKLGRRKNAEPGAWRVEIMPATPRAEDSFLVVLLPTFAGEQAPHRTRLLENGSRLGVEVAGPRRTLRWWLDPAEGGIYIEEISHGNIVRTHAANPLGFAGHAPRRPDA